MFHIRSTANVTDGPVSHRDRDGRPITITMAGLPRVRDQPSERDRTAFFGRLDVNWRLLEFGGTLAVAGIRRLVVHVTAIGKDDLTG